MARPGCRIGRSETFRLDCWLTVWALDRETRERSTAPFAANPVQRCIDQDAEEPGLQSGPCFEPIDAAQHPEPRLLDYLLGDRVICDVSVRDPHHKRVIRIDDEIERRFITSTQRGEKRNVVLHVRRRSAHSDD